MTAETDYGDDGTVTRLHRAGIRTTRITPASLFRMLQAASRDPVRVLLDVIPEGAAFGGSRFVHDPELGSDVLELDVIYHQWAANEIDEPLGLHYVTRLGPGDRPTDWGPPVELLKPQRPTR